MPTGQALSTAAAGRGSFLPAAFCHSPPKNVPVIPAYFCALQENYFFFLTTPTKKCTLASNSIAQTNDADEYALRVFSESRRWWDGGKSSFAEWTAEGGLNGIFPVSSDGYFPPLPGKACDGTSLSGRVKPSIWVAPQKFFRLLSQRNHETWSLEQRSFSFSKGPQTGKEHLYGNRQKQHSLQDLSL